MVLLLDARELSVALDTDHGDYRIHDVLLWDLHPPVPLGHTLEITELYLIASSVPVELYVESVVSQPRGIESNPSLPFIEFFNPRLKVRGVTFYYLCISHRAPSTNGYFRDCFSQLHSVLWLLSFEPRRLLVYVCLDASLSIIRLE